MGPTPIPGVKQIQEGRKDMFYFTTHSTHFIYGYMASDIYMVKDHSDSERGNPLPPHGLLFRISSKGSFICIMDNTYHGHCYTIRGALYGTRNNTMKDRSDDPLTTELHLAPAHSGSTTV